MRTMQQQVADSLGIIFHRITTEMSCNKITQVFVIINGKIFKLNKLEFPWDHEMALSQPILFTDVTFKREIKMAVCSSHTWIKSFNILKWNVGVISFRRFFHLSPSLKRESQKQKTFSSILVSKQCFVAKDTNFVSLGSLNISVKTIS